MPVIEEVLNIVRAMIDEERDELFRRLSELERNAWDAERAEATRAFHAAALTDDDTDEAVRKHRYEGRP